MEHKSTSNTFTHTHNVVGKKHSDFLFYFSNNLTRHVSKMNEEYYIKCLHDSSFYSTTAIPLPTASLKDSPI